MMRGIQSQCCDTLEGWDAEGGGREVQEGRDRCISKADSH